MQVRNLALSTQRAYLEQGSRFARHFDKSPELLGPEEIRAYQVRGSSEQQNNPNVRMEMPVIAEMWIYPIQGIRVKY